MTAADPGPGRPGDGSRDPAAGRRRFERHLAACPDCTEYLAQMRATIDLAGQITPDDMSLQMQDEFIALYRTWRAGPAGDEAPSSSGDD
jgi:anti-sigma factor RsiW